MVKPAHCLQLACVFALISISVLHAKDLAAYRIGDQAEDDISTPVALDVIDAGATAALKSSEALKTPAIFRSYPDTAGAVENEFLAAFAAAHSNFVASVGDTFHQPTVDDKTIASPDFSDFITAFNVKSKTFPVTAELAADWGRGDSGQAVQERLLGLFLQMMSRPVRPDELPGGFVIGETLRLVPAGGADEKLSLNDAGQRGKLITESSVTTISNLRALFRREFSEDQQPLARALSALLQPNCVPDALLTQQARDLAVRQLVMAEHYDAGQVIVRRGAAIDAKIKAALDELNEKLEPGVLGRQIAAERDRVQHEQDQVQLEHQQAQQAGALAQQEQQQAQQEHDRAQLARDEAQREHDQAVKMHAQALDEQNQFLKILERNEWLIAALAGVSILTVLAFWGLMRQRRRQTSALVPAHAVKLERIEKDQAVAPADLAPYLAQVLKEAVVQGLAAQRNELLQVQQSAAAEISQLVHRLDELQTPMRDRLRTYETRIEELEKDLAARNEENRELLKIKIEMLRKQLESERTRTRADFN
jgi:7TM-HD extracellular